MDETKFLDQPKVLITNTRIEINGQTFATRNIGSVKTISPKGKLPGALLLLVGLGALPSQLWWLVLGALALGAYLLYLAQTTRALVLVTGGGEVTALTGRAAAIEVVRAAVAQAISSR